MSVFDKELRNLVSDLTETMHDAPGAGLAAPQIGVSLRVFVWDIDDEPGHLINPVLDLSSELQEGEERNSSRISGGCKRYEYARRTGSH